MYTINRIVNKLYHWYWFIDYLCDNLSKIVGYIYVIAYINTNGTDKDSIDHYIDNLHSCVSHILNGDWDIYSYRRLHRAFDIAFDRSDVLRPHQQYLFARIEFMHNKDIAVSEDFSNALNSILNEYLKKLADVISKQSVEETLAWIESVREIKIEPYKLYRTV